MGDNVVPNGVVEGYARRLNAFMPVAKNPACAGIANARKSRVGPLAPGSFLMRQALFLWLIVAD